MNKMLHWKVILNNNYFTFFQSDRILTVSMTLIQFNMNIVIDYLETIQEEQISDDEESRIYRGQGKLLNKIIHIHVYPY